MVQAHYIYSALYFFVLKYYFVCWVFADVWAFPVVAHGLCVAAPGPEGPGSIAEVQGLTGTRRAGSSRPRDRSAADLTGGTGPRPGGRGAPL